MDVELLKHTLIFSAIGAAAFFALRLLLGHLHEWKVEIWGALVFL